MDAAPAVVGTNVVVSGLLTGDASAPTHRLLDGMLEGAFPYYLSVELFSEYREVLLRPNIQSLHELSEDEIDSVLETLALEAMFRDPETAEFEAPDPDDQHLWNLVDGVPDTILVTGDRELLDKAPPDVSVVSPRDYLELLRS